jgi:hypothetical protein
MTGLGRISPFRVTGYGLSLHFLFSYFLFDISGCELRVSGSMLHALCSVHVVVVMVVIVVVVVIVTPPAAANVYPQICYF